MSTVDTFLSILALQLVMFVIGTHLPQYKPSKKTTSVSRRRYN